MARTKQVPRKAPAGRRRSRRRVNPGAAAAPPRKRHIKAGRWALWEIMRLQKGTDFLLRKAPFIRLVREIAQGMDIVRNGFGTRWRKGALEAIQTAAKEFLIELYQKSYLCTLHAKRVTLMIRDMHLALELRRDTDGEYSVIGGCPSLRGAGAQP